MEEHQAAATQPPERIERLITPFQHFLHAETSGGIVLLACAVFAMAAANSPWAGMYDHFWHTQLTLGVGSHIFSESLHFWINDALMVVFFFVVGLEIKREVLVGELNSFRRAALPLAAALGGMVVPAAIYACFNYGTPQAKGWGIPMATDIAFALGVLALFGKGVPLALKVLLTAVAIVDDIGASLVIALFYSTDLSLPALGVAAALFAGMAGLNILGVRSALVYLASGIGLWLAFLSSGVHPTMAGILAAFAIPARTRLDAAAFLDVGRTSLGQLKAAGKAGTNVLANREQQRALNALELATLQAQTPLQRLEAALHPWVSFVIMPVFALANAGVPLAGSMSTLFLQPVAAGTMFGLLFGKQLGITFFAWSAVKLGLAALPEGVSWLHIYVVAWLGGIGFTMSLFIADLAFGRTPALEAAKAAILAASLLSGLGAAFFFFAALRK